MNFFDSSEYLIFPLSEKFKNDLIIQCTCLMIMILTFLQYIHDMFSDDFHFIPFSEQNKLKLNLTNDIFSV